VVLQALARHPFSTEKELLAESGLDLEVATEAFSELVALEAVAVIDAGPSSAYLTVEAYENALARLADHATAFHEEYPLRKGIARGELRSRLQRDLTAKLSVRLFNGLIEAGEASGRIEADDSQVWVPGREIKLTPLQQSSVDSVLNQFASAGFSPPNNNDVLRALGNDAELLEMLVEQGKLLRLGGGLLFRRQEYDQVVEYICAHLADHGTITLAETRDLLRTSRKYAQAILEAMDSERITRRDGDHRILRTG
jgi:selenocysteine-specific elongation factor